MPKSDTVRLLTMRRKVKRAGRGSPKLACRSALSRLRLKESFATTGAIGYAPCEQSLLNFGSQAARSAITLPAFRPPTNRPMAVGVVSPTKGFVEGRTPH